MPVGNGRRNRVRSEHGGCHLVTVSDAGAKPSPILKTSIIPVLTLTAPGVNRGRVTKACGQGGSVVAKFSDLILSNDFRCPVTKAEETRGSSVISPVPQPLLLKPIGDAHTRRGLRIPKAIRKQLLLR